MATKAGRASYRTPAFCKTSGDTSRRLILVQVASDAISRPRESGASPEPGMLAAGGYEGPVLAGMMIPKAAAGRSTGESV